jgi:hypothetical protein
MINVEHKGELKEFTPEKVRILLFSSLYLADFVSSCSLLYPSLTSSLDLRHGSRQNAGNRRSLHRQQVSHIIVPAYAYFNSARTIAGLNIPRIISEPTSTAIAYGLDKMDGESQIIVSHLGGGIFDVSPERPRYRR